VRTPDGVACSTGVGRQGRDAARRERILRRDRFRCVYCGEAFAAEELTLDHVEPRMRGGDGSEGNLVACCRACNEEKGHQPAWQYLAQRPEQRARFMAAVETCDASEASPVWSRLLRAIEQAAANQRRA
jgi:5-methylcytosine-specific restriction endonuclease McrA